MKKLDNVALRDKAHKKIRAMLQRKKTAREIAETTGYTTSRIYQIKAVMVKAGELQA